MIGDLFNLFLLQPLINYFVFILRLLEAIGIPGSLGLAVIIITLSIKFVLWKISDTQIRTMKKTSETMALIRPKLSELKKKHKDDKLAFAKAQQDLMKEHGYNPTAGCLPNLILAILIYPLYQVILAFVDPKNGIQRINYFLYDKSWSIDRLPDPNFLGLDLSKHPADFASAGWFLLLVPVVTGLLQFIYSKMISPAPVKEYPSDSKKEKEEKEEYDEMAQAMQGQMMYILPVMIGVFSWNFPIALALYWNVLNVISMVQQYLVSGWGGLESISKLKLK